MITWTDLSSTLSRLLDDADEAEFSEQDKIWAWNAAQRHFVTHTPRQQIQTGLTVSSSGRELQLPDDFFSMGRLWGSVNERYWTPAGEFAPGAYDDATSNNEVYTLWGNTMYLGDDVPESNTFKLWYYAYWPDIEFNLVDSVVTVTAEDILVPMWAETALSFLTAAFVLLTKSVQSAMVRTWNMNIDSGNPLQNSRVQEAWDKYKWYVELIRPHSPLVQGGYV